MFIQRSQFARHDHPHLICALAFRMAAEFRPVVTATRSGGGTFCVGTCTPVQDTTPAPHPAMLGFDIAAFTAGSERIAGAAEGARFPRKAGALLAAVAESADQFEYRVECGFERFGVAFDLGEEQAAL
jgi:hypothetical protein